MVSLNLPESVCVTCDNQKTAFCATKLVAQKLANIALLQRPHDHFQQNLGVLQATAMFLIDWCNWI